MRVFLISVLLIGSLCFRSNAAPAALIDSDFGAAAQPVAIATLTPTQSIQGVVPDGWYDNSSWNPTINVRYQVLSEAGVRFWRVENGPIARAQLAHSLPDVTARCTFDLTVTARGDAQHTVECGVRLVGSPYDNVGPFHLDLSTQWQTFHYRVSINPQSQSVGFWFNFDPGLRMDIRTFTLKRLDRADLIDEIKARYPNGGQGNLARSTRFPLGLPVGWAVPSDEALGRAVTVSTDPTAIGPSGTPALRIESADGAAVTAAPFHVPWSFAPHVLSLAVKGQGSIQIQVRGDNHVVSSKDFTLTNDWQRVVAPFTPLFDAKSNDFQVRVKGTAWLDALQVEQGDTATSYAAPMPAEVALACPQSDASVARIQFTDEPDRITFAVAGSAAGDLVHAVVTDIYGDTRTLPTAAADATGQGVIRYSVFPDRPLGPFRITAWVTDSQGHRRSDDGEIVVSRLHRPRYWNQDALSSPFGVHIDPTPHQALMAKSIGANWVRTHDCGLQITGWSFLEPTKGDWHFDDSEAAVYRNEHLEILGMLSTAPGWATSLGRPATGYFDRYVEPNSMDDWANYVQRTTAHYKGVISYYEVWNEPAGDYWGVWDNQSGRSVKAPTSAEHFALLLKTAYQSAKIGDPDVSILGFSDAFTQPMLAQSIVPSCDIVSYHHYTDQVNGAKNDDVDVVHETAVKPMGQGVSKPVWLSEGNAVDGLLDVGMYKVTAPGAAPDDNWDAVNRLTRFVVSLLAHGDQKLFLYTMHEDSALGMGGGDWRTLLTADGYLHPCGAAYAAMTWRLEGLHASGIATPAPGVTSFTFVGQKRTVVVYAGAVDHAPFTIPTAKGDVIEDVFGNPLSQGSKLGATLVYVSNGH